MDIESLKRNGHLYVKYPPELRFAVEESVSAWKAFCELPEEKKILFEYEQDVKTSGNGYEHKKSDTSVDVKENAHVRTIARNLLLFESAKADPVIGPAFVEKALAVVPLMQPIIREFARTVEKELHVPGFEEDVMAYEPHWLVRYLHYFGDRKVGEELAAPHTDKGGFTLHLYESAGGVEYLTYDTREWKELPLSLGETVIIPGVGIQNRTKCQLKALAHRVIAVEDAASIGRYSAVCFFGFNNTRYFDKATFGPQQNYAPGTFYDVPFEQFDSFFID